MAKGEARGQSPEEAVEKGLLPPILPERVLVPPTAIDGL